MTAGEPPNGTKKRILLRSGKGPFTVMAPERMVGMRPSPMGGNAGNLVFSHAAHKLLERSDTEVVSNKMSSVPDDADRINERYDVFVIPLANAFREDFAPHLTRLADLVERLTIPCVVMGVGAQAPTYDLAAVAPMKELAKRFLSAVLDRSASIGVRGEFTADYIRQLGFSDVEIIGCPSMFMYGPHLPPIARPDALTSGSHITVTASRRPFTAEMAGIIDRHHQRYPNLIYVSQDERDLDLLLWGEPRKGLERNGLPVTIDHPMYLENKMRFFCDPWPWIDYLRTVDFSFGTRIHGGVVSLLAGTPTYVLTHDSRTLELARHFEIPHQPLADTPPDVDAADLLERADYAALHSGHAKRFEAVAQFLERNDLKHSYAEGGTPQQFERRVAETYFPAGVEPVTSSMLEVIHRLRYLRAGRDQLVERVEVLEQDLHAEKRQTAANEAARARLKKRIKKLEAAQARGGWLTRLRRKISRS